MKISLIVAMDNDRGIGKDNDLLWHLPADMRFFKETTSGHVVVMVRKNFESIPEKFRPLPNRENAVLTRNKDYKADGCMVFHSLEECLKHYSETDKTVFIIGGGEIYREVLKLDVLSEMYISWVKTHLDADTFFPEIENEKWDVEDLFHHPIDEKNKYSFTVRKYIRN